MTSTRKILLLLLPLGIVLLIAIVHFSSNDSGYADNIEENAVKLQTIRHRRTIHYCKFNQYYDQEEGRCLGVPGGGKVLHVENRRSCGVNVLRPHCRSSLYYHICKRDKSILAQCASRQIFDARLQRCAYYDSSKLTPKIIPPDDYMYYGQVTMPSCTRSGRFPVPGHCSMFYTCDTNGHRLHQSVFKCPQNTGYEVDRGVCNAVPDCVNDNSVDTTVCVPDAPGENVESPSGAAEGNLKEIPETLEESQAGAGDPTVEKEENVNSKTYDDITISTPVSVISAPSENNYNDNDSDTDVTGNSAKLNEDFVLDDIDEKIMHSRVPDPPEIVQKVSDEGQNEEDGSLSLIGLRTASPSMIDTSHSTSTTPIEPEYRTNADVDSETTDAAPFCSGSYILSKLGKGAQDAATERYNKDIGDSAVTLPNFNSEPIDAASTMSNAPEIPPVSDVLSTINEKTRDVTTEQFRNNEDGAATPSNFNTDLVNLHSVPTISNVPESSIINDMPSSIDEKMQDEVTEQYKNKEGSAAKPSNFNTDLVNLHSVPTINNVPESSIINNMSPNMDEKIQEAATEQDKNNEDSVVTPSNFNTDLHSAPTISNIPESALMNDMPSSIDKKLQDAVTEYKNNEDSAVTPSNFNTDSVDLHSAPIISNIPKPSLINDMSPNMDEKIQEAATEQDKNNEDSVATPSNFNTDLHSAPTISNIPESALMNDMPSSIDKKVQDEVTEQYKNNEDSAVTPSNFNTDSVDLHSAPTISNVPEPSLINDMSPHMDEKIQEATEQYKNDEDSVVTPSNFNTDLRSAPTISNVPESSIINDMPSSIDEKMQDEVTEQYKNKEGSAAKPSNFNTDSVDLHSAPTISNVPESSLINDMSPNMDEKIQDAVTEQYENNEDSAVTPSNFNTDSVDLHSAPTISNVPESSLISDMSPNIDERMQDAAAEYKNNEDSAVTPSNFNTDLHSAPTISNIPESLISDTSPNINKKTQDAVTVQYKTNEDSIEPFPTPTASNVPGSLPISDTSPNVDEKVQDAITEQYKNNGDSAPAFNSDSIDPTLSRVLESSAINDTSSKLDEEIQNEATEVYGKHDGGAVTLPSSNAEVIDPNLASALNDTPAIADSPRNDDSDVSSPSILPPQAAAVEQLATDGLSEAVPSTDSEPADASLSTPGGVESVSARYSPENTDDLYSTPTTGSTLVPEEETAPTDIATTVPSTPPPITHSDTDLAMQNGKDSTEASPVPLTE
ncbi:PREDICTED: uncharacterized protein LOC105451150 isoform X2 [Wasmannia auropunctata]|uniref:uncharacterized protein LOC105451150 isoform X2 n=1 Tax=Wasmannia auropunctata TaxID=64793 RepID=UPI0005EDE949|nr:PREDICTED: uncharacterized protein LOC105451150 isoform X2 [Wasmannia auropunctata]